MIRQDRKTWNEYMRKNHAVRYLKLRTDALIFLGNKCFYCGSVNNLEFDHIDPKTKEIEVSRMLNVSLERFWNEVKKCQLLCRTCHIKKTIVERGLNDARNTHGTISSYRYCKCALCKKAWNTHSNNYRKRKRAELAKRSTATVL